MVWLVVFRLDVLAVRGWKSSGELVVDSHASLWAGDLVGMTPMRI